MMMPAAKFKLFIPSLNGDVKDLPISGAYFEIH
jgi:hypothetical protein